MAVSGQEVREAKREASARYLASLPDIPQFAALTMDGITAAALPLLNVHAVGVGPKIVAGAPDPVLAVRFYVLRKVPTPNALTCRTATSHDRGRAPLT